MKRKGIILAGGQNSRLFPTTLAVGKQLLPVYDKPMIYYPLCTLMQAGITEILVISTERDTPRLKSLLEDGSQWGISLSYLVQSKPEGIAQALCLAESFLNQSSCALILGDNIFHAPDFQAAFKQITIHDEGAHLFAYHVENPAHYGVVQLDTQNNPIHLEEKPKQPNSHLAVTGLYFYDAQASKLASSLKPSNRGELEITELNQVYLEQGNLKVHQAPNLGNIWLDAGTPESLLEAAQLVAAIQRRQGLLLGSPEQTAYQQGYIDQGQLTILANKLTHSGYGQLLLKNTICS